jgi:hypothetical protein
MMDAVRNLVQHGLVGALLSEQWKRWHPHLEYVDMPLGDVLYEPWST